MVKKGSGKELREKTKPIEEEVKRKNRFSTRDNVGFSGHGVETVVPSTGGTAVAYDVRGSNWNREGLNTGGGTYKYQGIGVSDGKTDLEVVPYSCFRSGARYERGEQDRVADSTPFEIRSLEDVGNDQYRLVLVSNGAQSFLVDFRNKKVSRLEEAVDLNKTPKWSSPGERTIDKTIHSERDRGNPETHRIDIEQKYNVDFEGGYNAQVDTKDKGRPGWITIRRTDERGGAGSIESGNINPLSRDHVAQFVSLEPMSDERYKFAGNYLLKLRDPSSGEEKAYKIHFFGGGTNTHIEDVKEKEDKESGNKTSSKLTPVIATLGLLSGIFFLSNNITGNVVATDSTLNQVPFVGNAILNLSTQNISLIGAGLIAIGLIAGFFWIKKKKKKK